MGNASHHFRGVNQLESLNWSLSWSLLYKSLRTNFILPYNSMLLQVAYCGLTISKEFTSPIADIYANNEYLTLKNQPSGYTLQGCYIDFNNARLRYGGIASGPCHALDNLSIIDPNHT